MYANIQLHTHPTLNPQPVLYEPQHYPQSHYSHAFDATQDTFALIQPQQNLFEPNTSFTQLLFAPFSTNLLDSQTFEVTKDQPNLYLCTLAVEPTLLI